MSKFEQVTTIGMSARKALEVSPPHLPSSSAWANEDEEWEDLQEQAQEQVIASCPKNAGELWDEAFIMARNSFPIPDPRLATSMANCAFFAVIEGNRESASHMFRDAIEIWKTCGPWVDTLNIERNARSSSFHLRMETRHWNTYQATQRKKLTRLVDEGLHATVALSRAEMLDLRGYARWKKEKPLHPTDVRKLLAAVMLTVRLNEIGNLE